jgi:hypothetical protein
MKQWYDISVLWSIVWLEAPKYQKSPYFIFLISPGNLFSQSGQVLTLFSPLIPHYSRNIDRLRWIECILLYVEPLPAAWHSPMAPTAASAGWASLRALAASPLPGVRPILAVVLLQNFKPSEPHIVPYLRQVKGLSNEDIFLRVFPHFTYSYLVFTLLVPLCAGRWGLVAMLQLGAVCRIATRFLLLYGSSLPAFQLLEWTYGVGIATENVALLLLLFSLSRAQILDPSLLSGVYAFRGLLSPGRVFRPSGFSLPFWVSMLFGAFLRRTTPSVPAPLLL